MIVIAFETVLYKKYLSDVQYTITYSEYLSYKWSTRLQSMHNLHNHMVGLRQLYLPSIPYSLVVNRH